MQPLAVSVPFYALCSLALLGCSPETESTRIAVAASLSDVVPPLYEQFVAHMMAQGEQVELEIMYGGSGELIAQQRHSELFDSMFLASREAMNPLLAAGKLEQFSQVRLGNSLSLVVSGPQPSVLGEDSFSITAFMTQGRPVAIGGLGVPAGDYARAWLGSIEGLEPSLLNLVEFPNVRAVVAAVEGGAVSGGFVYATDVLSRGGFSTVAQWAPDSGGPEYGYASVEGSHHGAEFGEFIGEHLDQLVSAGFTVLLEGE